MDWKVRIENFMQVFTLDSMPDYYIKAGGTSDLPYQVYYKGKIVDVFAMEHQAKTYVNGYRLHGGSPHHWWES
jgi:hypothetical protein